MTQRTGRKTSVGNGSYNGLFKLPGGKPLGTQWKTVGGTVSIRVTGNKGRKRGRGYLRILFFSPSFFCASFVERTSGEGVFFRVTSNWIAETPQFRVTGSWFAGTPQQLTGERRVP
jgi:hypothetical protein